MKKYLTLTLVTLLLVSLLAGCGASSKATHDSFAKNEIAMEAPMASAPMDPMAEEMGIAQDSAMSAGGDTDHSSAIPENRKWIITVDMSAETEDLTAMLDALYSRIAALNGYVENQNVYNGSNYSARRYRSASLTLRIPAEVVDQFAENMEGMANVVRSTKNLEDITLTYVSTESRVKALQTEEARLLELMEQAETMYDLLEIEGRLTEVRYQLENYTSRLKVYDNQVEFATIYLSLEEVQEYTPVAERTVWQRITEGFGDSLEGVWEGAVDLFVWIIVSLPYLVVWGAVVTVLVILVKRIRRRKPVKSFPRKADKEAKPEIEE
jgi:hypothetical protein